MKRQYLLVFFIATIIASVRPLFVFAQSESDTLKAFKATSAYAGYEAGEDIDLTSGALKLTAEDISLPGRAGLNLSIKRFYKSFVDSRDFEGPLKHWSTLGMGWQCFAAVYRNTGGSINEFQSGILYMGDGSVYTFWGNAGQDLYCHQKPRWRISHSDFVLKFEDGSKYYFGPQINGGLKPVVKSEDVHGNYITYTYKPGTLDIDSIFDTAGRIVKFKWSEAAREGTPTQFIINKLDFIMVRWSKDRQAVDLPWADSTGWPVKKNMIMIKYDYTPVSFYTLENAFFSGPALTGVKKITYSSSGDSVVSPIANYEYSQITKQDAAWSRDSADVGQLVKIIQPWGGFIKYHYRAAYYKTLENAWGTWVVLGSKGFSTEDGILQDSLWTYQYENEPSTVAFPRLNDKRFWFVIKVTNKKAGEHQTHTYSVGKTTWLKDKPMLKTIIDSSARGEELKRRTFVWAEPSDELYHVLSVPRFPRILNEETKVGNNYKVTYYKNYSYIDSTDINKYCRNYGLDIATAEYASFNPARKRITTKNYLHNQNINYLNANILNKITFIKVTEINTAASPSTVILSSDSSEYDQLPLEPYNDVSYEPCSWITTSSDLHGNKTRYLQRKNVSFIAREYRYDKYGNMVKSADPLGNITTYNYGYVPLYSSLYYEGVYLCGIFNQQYGLTKGYSHDPLTGRIISTYNYTADITEASSGTSLNTLSSAYTGDDNEINYAPATGWDVLPPPPGCMAMYTRYSYDGLGRINKIWQPGDRYCPKLPDIDEPSNVYEYYDRGDAAGHPYIIERQKRGNGQDNEYTKIAYIYDSRGNLIQTQRLIDPNDTRAVITSYKYDSHNLNTRQTRPYNGQLARLGTYAAPAWSSLASDSFVYDGLQRPVKTIYPDGNFVSKQYDGNYEINTDANGQITTFQYDPFGNLASVVDAQGSATAYESDCLGRLKTITPPAGNPSSYFYNGLGQLTEMQTPDMGGKKFVYDDAGNLRFMQDANRMGDPNGNWVYYRYDKTGRMTSSGLYKYTGTGDPIFVPSDTGSIEYLQPTTINIYDEYYGYRDTTIGAANASWFSEPSQPDSFIISGNGVSNIIGINATYVRSKNIYATDGTPGSTGITEETEPVDYDTVCFWGKPELFIGKAETDIFSDRWRTYIEPIDLSQFYKSDEDTILGIYLCLHNRNINPSANVVLYRLPYYYYKYYADGYLYCYENPWKIKSTTWLVQPSYGGTDSDVNYENVAEDTLNKYDSMRTVWQTSGCVDSVNISDWAKSWLNGSLLQNGIMISEESDINFYYATVSTYPPYLNIITSDTVPCNITLKPTYPGADYFTVYWTTSELAKCEVQYSTDESYSNVIVSQDEYFNHSITISGLNQNTVYNYRIKAVDKSGNLTFTRGLQFKTGDLPGIAYYMFSRGRPTVSMSEGDTAVFSYDERGRLLAKKTKRSGRSYLERRQYDKQNNLIAFETTSNGTTNYFYNAMGQLSSIVCGDNQLASYTYTAAGACSTEAFGNGVSSIYSYHPRQWLKAAAMTGNSGTMFNHAYQYDANGNLTFDEDNTGLSSSTDRYYAYDPLNRLTYEGSQPGPNAIDVTLPGVVNYGLSYRYDARGNRTSGAGASYSYYPGTNRLQAVTNPDGSQTPYDYDGNGNTVYDGRWQYEYDFQNRQSRVHSEASTSINNINYTYNAAGLRTGSVNSLTQFGGQVASLAATFPEPYEDLVESAPSGDGHDDARDMGTLKVHVNDNFLFFEITHKYLYGTSQGNYENIYIALDTDQKFGSGASWLPDDIKVRVTADNAWERCIVIYDEQNFGICTAEGFRLEKLETDDGKKMKVNYTNGRNSKAIIKVPVALLGNPEKVRFVIVSTMPGAASYKISTACDVLPGGKKSIDSQLLTAYNEYTMPLAPGAVRSTTTTEGYLYDNDGNLMADLDGEKNITKRYVYGLGGKHLAMQINNTGYGPYSNACDDTANISIGGDSSPLTFNFTTDKQQGAFALQVNVGNPSGVGCNAGNFGLYNQGIEVESANYGYVHIWVKPLTAGSWMTFHVWDVKYGDWKTLKGDKDGDMYYEADQDMAVGQWNELWLKLDNNDKEWTQTKVRSFSMHASNNASFIIDGVYTCSRDWKTFYYSCDYLNSPRVMTDATGAVVWRQDYLAFGSEAGTVATGNTHKFTGHIKDDATGQYYAKARYFTTGLGRWSQPEPLLKGVPSKGFLMNSQMLNPYVYCHNNPIKYSDPDGHLPWNEIAAGKNDIRSSFGPRTDPVTKAPARHEGMDVRMQTGTNLRSAAAGTIINVENKTTGYGTNITIQHENGFTTRYGHMNSTSVSVGQQVNEGQTIGTSGSTGKSTGPHLHFEVRQNGAAIDPTTVNLGAYNSYPSDPQAQQTIENLKPWGVEFNKDPAKSKPIPEVQ